MQVQSAADSPKKILLGERAVMADGNDYNLLLLKDRQTGRGGVSGRRRTADHCSLRHLPQRAQSERGKTVPEFFLQRRGPAITGRHLCASLVPYAGQGEAGSHAAVGAELLKADLAAVQAQSEETKARYSKLFGV